MTRSVKEVKQLVEDRKRQGTNTINQTCPSLRRLDKETDFDRYELPEDRRLIPLGCGACEICEKQVDKFGNLDEYEGTILVRNTQRTRKVHHPEGDEE